MARRLTACAALAAAPRHFVLESGSIEPIDVLRRVAADSVAEIYFIEADDRIRYGPAFPGSNPALTFSPSAEPTSAASAGQEHILEQEDGKKRWVQVVTELSRALHCAPPETKQRLSATT